MLKDLAAVAQSMAPLELVDKGDGFVIQPEQHFLLASGRQTATVGLGVVRCRHKSPGYACELLVTV